MGFVSGELFHSSIHARTLMVIWVMLDLLQTIGLLDVVKVLFVQDVVSMKVVWHGLMNFIQNFVSWHFLLDLAGNFLPPLFGQPDVWQLHWMAMVSVTCFHVELAVCSCADF